MARTIAGELTLPDGSPLANAAIHFTAKRTEAVRILEDVSSFFTTSSTGAYSQDVESGYYAVSVSYAAVPGTQPRRWHLGDVWVEDGDPISLTALLALNNSAADPTDSALRQLLADAQAARDEAQAAAQEAEQYRDETASMLDSKIDESEKGEPGGVATLDSGGRVPAAQLPSYVDDVEEYADYAALPRPAETGKIYITLDTNRQYRWGGSDYIELVASPGTTDNVPEGSSNLYHTAARVRAVALAGISFASSAAITASDTILSAFGKIQAKLNTLKGMAFLDKASQAQQLAGESDSVGTTPLGVRRFVQQFGLGTTGAVQPEVTDVDEAKTSGLFRIPPSATGHHPWPSTSSGLWVVASSSSYVEQIAVRGGNNISNEIMALAFRHFNGTEWSGWQYTWHSGNLPQSSIDSWNTAYGWGDHADAGYYSPDNVGTPGKNLLAASTQEAAREAIGFDSVSPATPANGGLLVDNQKTGAGLERVLTESDLVGYVNVRGFGAVGDGIANDTAAFNAAKAALNTLQRRLYVPNGTYLLDEFVLPDGAALVGESMHGVVLRLTNSSQLTPRPADPTVTITEQTYLPFIYTASAGHDGATFADVHVSNLTIDWNGQPASSRAAAPLWLGDVKGGSVSRIRVINQLPSDYSIATSQGRGVSVLLTYCADIAVSDCVFDGQAAYEELGIRYSNRNITIERNLFAGKGSWRHNIEVASAANISTVATAPRSVRIVNNEFRLHGAKQDCISCHDTGTVVIQGNSFTVESDLVDTTQSGFRCLVKKFDGNEGQLLVDGNSFDFLSVPNTVKRAFECVRTWSDNCVVSNNTFRGRTDGFDNSLDDIALYPWVGVGDGSKDHKALTVTGNVFELHQYTASVSPVLIKCGARGASISGNVLNLVHPLVLGGSSEGPIFIDINGISDDGTDSGVVGGQSITVMGNASYASVGNVVLIGIRFRGVSNFYTAVGNTLSGCRDRIVDTATGPTKYIEGNL